MKLWNYCNVQYRACWHQNWYNIGNIEF